MNPWLKDALERAGATFAEVILPCFIGANLFDVDYRAGVGIAGAAAVGSLLKSVVARYRGDRDSASLVK